MLHGVENTVQAAKLNTQSFAKDENKENSSLIDYIQVENTPFTIIRQETRERLAIGDYILTEWLPIGTAIKYMETNKWQLITTLIIAVMQKTARDLGEMNKKKQKPRIKKSTNVEN